MSQVLVVFGATGQQGGSVANFVAANPELSKRYRIRGITRDATKPAAAALKAKGIEVAEADLDDEASIRRAVEGAHTVFAMTQTIYDGETKAREIRQGRAVADAAVAAGAQYIIWSSQCHTGNDSGGKYPISSFDSKAEVEEYIRSLPVKSAFFAPASFMQNLTGGMAPRPTGDANNNNTYAITSLIPGSIPIPWIDIASDTGKFIGAVLANPEAYSGKTLYAASGLHTYDEVARLIGARTGKTVQVRVVPEAVYRGFMRSAAAADALVNMWFWIRDFGYYGPETAGRVEWSAKQALGGGLTGLEEFVEREVRLE